MSIKDIRDRLMRNQDIRSPADDFLFDRVIEICDQLERMYRKVKMTSSPSREELAQKVCSYCGGNLEIKAITSNDCLSGHKDDTRDCIVCMACSKIEHGTTPEIYKLAVKIAHDLFSEPSQYEISKCCYVVAKYLQKEAKQWVE